MSYLDFDIRLELTGDDGLRASVLRSPAGEVSATIPVPPSLETMGDSIRALIHAQLMGRSRRTELQAPMAAAGVPLLRVEEYGQQLFDTLMPAAVLGSYRVSLERARAEGKGLRVRLRLDDANLAAVPWEYVFDPSLGDHICLSNETSVVRYLDVERTPASLTIKPPLQVLGLVSSPSNLPSLDIERERSNLERSVEHLTEKGIVRIEWLEGATWRSVQAAMRRGPWHVLHYIGHGGMEQGGSRGVLALCDDDGEAFYLPGDDFGRLLSGHGSMRLVVLNSCESGRGGSSDLLSSAAAELIRRGVPAVVAMQFEITDRAALEFSRTFYEALVDGAELDRAVGDARKSIGIALGDSCEWGTPVLHMHSLDGTLFAVDVVSAVFPQSPEASAAEPAAGQPAVPQPAAGQQPAPRPATSMQAPRTTQAPPADEMRRGHLLLARKVRTFWVEGVLERSLFSSARIDLGMERIESAVVSPWKSVLNEASGTSQPLPAGKSIADVFLEEGGSLLILGEPGSGKTTTMLGLLRELLDKVESDPTDPIPVVFNLSSWAEGELLDQWLVDELSTKYQIPRKVGRVWLDRSSLLPLLDGLDEVKASVRPACVDAINRFLESGVRMGTVVCCRAREYIDLPNRLALNTAVQLRELTRNQVLECVRASGPALAALHDVLQRDSDLLLEARSILMLSLMAQAYRDVSAEELAHESMESTTIRRQRIMEAYVTRMFRRAAGGGRG